MAKKEITFEEIARDIKARKFQPIYVLMGEEPFFIDQVTDLLIENVLSDSERDFNQIILYGADTDAISIINAARRFPMMSDYQLVVGGISLLTLPVAYLFLKLGYPPYSAMVIGILFSVLCLMARVIMLRLIIKFPMTHFFRYVVLRILATALCSVPIPLLVYWKLPVNWLSFLLVCFVCVMSTGLFCFYIGLQENERAFIKKRVKSILLRKTE